MYSLQYQCNEARTEDAPAADISLSNQMTAKKGSEAGWFTLFLLAGILKYYFLCTSLSMYAIRSYSCFGCSGPG